MTSPSLDGSKAAALEVQQYLKSRLSTKSASASFRSIPVIDLSPSFSSSLPARQAVAEEIHKACTTVGFFYITGHGLENTCSETIKLAKRFFTELSDEGKEKIHMKNSKYFRGYEPPDYTTINNLDIEAVGKETKESFSWGYEAGLDSTGGDGKYVELDGSKPDGNANLWPGDDEVPEFYNGIADYYGKVCSSSNIGKKID